MNTIKVKYGLEEITARVPGLFPYLEFDENHVSNVHPASDSDVGCYGKIACALMMPNGVSLDVEYEEEDEEGQPITITKNVIVPGQSYTYKTLMGVYYKYRDEYPTNSFIQFMEKGIGKFKITANIDFEYCTLVPEYEYYANCARLFNEYTQIGLMCSKYLQMKEITGEVNCELECLVEKYARMGGDVMRDYYGNLADYSNTIASEYFGYLSTDFNLCFDVNVTTTENDFGILNTFINFFGTKYVSALYVVEEIVVPGTNPPIYNTQVVRIVRQVDPQDPTHPRSQDTININEKYYLDDTCVLEAVRGVDYFLPGDFVVYNDRTYVCEQPTINGEWILNRFHLVTENYSDQTPDYKAYYSPEVDRPYTPVTIISGTANSQLNGFIGDKNYIDEGGVIRVPGNDTRRVTDYLWLWYYRIGDVGFSSTETDRFNNIVVNGTRNTNIGQYEMHLMAYGDIITNITRNTTDRTITFEYYIGAHFKAKLLDVTLDDDGNERYFYGEYEYDSDDTQHGVKHVETYEYNMGGDIDSMDDDRFEKYVTYDSNGNSRRLIIDTYTKGEFNVGQYGSMATMMVNGQEFTYSYIVSNFSIPLQMSKDSLTNPLTRFDYLVGTAYNPTVKSDVHISRGNAAAWERHMKLGELKTFEDLETYSNGGFFNLR